MVLQILRTFQHKPNVLWTKCLMDLLYRTKCPARDICHMSRIYDRKRNPTWLQSYAFGRGRPLRESCAPVLFKTDVSSYDFRLRFSQLFKLKRASGLVLYVHQLVKSLPGEGRSWFLLCRDFMEVLEQSISPRTKSALLRPRWSLSCTFQSFSALSNFAHWGPINCYVPGTVISFCFRDTLSFTTHDSTVT